MAISMYWLVIRCPACGRMVRGNAIQRALADRQRGFFDDIVGMPVKSQGYGKIQNEKIPLWPHIHALMRELREPAADLLEELARRLRDAGYEASDAARRMRYG